MTNQTIQKLRDFGLDVTNLRLGKITPVRLIESESNRKKGWYVVREARNARGETVFYGTAGNWRTGEIIKIKPEMTAWTEEEKAEWAKARQLERESEAAREARKHAQAAAKANAIWADAMAADANHPYLVKKGITPRGQIRQDGEDLIIAVRQSAGVIAGLQRIDPRGAKTFGYGTQKKGGYCVVAASKEASLMLVCEGYATAVSLSLAMPLANVVCAFDAHNLAAVATKIRQNFAGKIVICADADDSGIGEKCANDAARAVDASVCVPVFSDKGDKSDFNDLHAAEGLAAVTNQINAHIEAQNISSEFPRTPKTDAEPATDAADGDNIDAILDRYCLVEGTTQIFDREKHAIIKAAAAKMLFGKQYSAWLTHPRRQTVDASLVRKAVAAAERGRAGFDLDATLERFYLIYGTSDVYDNVKLLRIPAANLKLSLGGAAFKAWQESPNRKTVDADCVIFDPTGTLKTSGSKINTFRGLPFANPEHDQVAGSCSAILELLGWLCGIRDDATTDENAEPVQIMDWLTKWLAYPIQRVGAKMASAVIIHGHTQGAGKSLFWEECVKPLYGRYAVTIGSQQLESNFNAWESEKLFILGEEVVSRELKYHFLGMLKHKITGKTRQIDVKHVSGWEEKNHTNYVILSNEAQPIPVEAEDRRFLVVNALDKLPTDLRDKVMLCLSAGGAHGFYEYLRAVPLGDFNTHTEPPKTTAWQKVVDFGAHSVQQFYNMLLDASLPEPTDNDLGFRLIQATTDQYYRMYKAYCTRAGERDVSRVRFKSLFEKAMGNRPHTRTSYSHGGKIKTAYFFIPAGLSEPSHLSRGIWLYNGICEVNKWLGGDGEAFCD